MNDTNTVGTTGKTVEQIVSDWENTKMTKAEIVRHFVEICKMDEEILARETEEINFWKEMASFNFHQSNLLQQKINNIKYLLDCGKHEIPKFWIDLITQSLGE